MRTKEFKRVFEMAERGEGNMDETQSLSGIALHKDRVVCTAKGCAAALRWDCWRWDGTWDTEELNSYREYFRRVEVVG